jgi:hypothetical protein
VRPHSLGPVPVAHARPGQGHCQGQGQGQDGREVTVDLRLEVFNLIDRDRVLRALLLAYADRLDGSHVPDGTPLGDCFLALQWTTSAPDAGHGTEVLTAFAHMPRRSPSGFGFLDSVLERVQAAVSDDAARTRVRARWTGTSPEVIDRGCDTVFKTSTFEFAPALQSPKRGRRAGSSRPPGPAPVPAPRVSPS